MKPLSLLLALLSFVLYLAIICGPANGSVTPATDSATSTLTLTVLPAVQIEILDQGPETVSALSAEKAFTIHVWANTAWSITELTISSGMIEDGSCAASRTSGPRNLDDRPQEVSLVCLQPLSWADGPGLQEMTIGQVIAAPLSE